MIDESFSIAASESTNHSYHFKNGNIPLSSITLGELLDNAVDTYGDRIYVVSHHQGISKTYSEFRNEVQTLASGFIASGLKRGDRLAIFSPNCYEWALTQFAAAKAGLILVNLNFLSESEEVEWYLKTVSCTALIMYDKYRRHDYYEILNRIIPDLPTSDPKNLKSEKFPGLKYIMVISDEHKKGTLRFKDISSSGNSKSDAILSQTEKLIQFDDPVNIQFTSGTTNVPKGAVVTHRNVINNAIRTSELLQFHIMTPILCCQVPLFHTFGCVAVSLCTIVVGGTFIMPSPGFDSKESLKIIEKYRCNSIHGTPTMMIDIIKNYKLLQTDISSLKTVCMAGSSLQDGLFKELYNDLKIPSVVVCYGLTETSSTVCSTKAYADLEAMSSGFMESVGELEVKIIDNDGRIVSKGERGEICIRGYNVFSGYWNNKVKTEEAIDKSRWFHTGDLGVMNEKGWMKIVGRIKDVVIRGGENIWTAEIESFLSVHPAISEVHICGVPDHRLGEELCCWIHVEPGMNLTEEEVRNFCRGKISYYKIPRYIMFVEKFPTTTSGKVRKTEMARISMEKLNLKK